MCRTGSPTFLHTPTRCLSAPQKKSHKSGAAMFAFKFEITGAQLSLSVGKASAQENDLSYFKHAAKLYRYL